MKFFQFIFFITFYLFFNNQFIFADQKYNRVRCRDVFCSYKSQQDRKKLIKLAKERRGYKEPRVPWNIRLRYLYSLSVKDNKNLNNTSIYIIWNKFGFGQSNLKYKQKNNNTSYNMYNTSVDISYTFGTSWTFTVGKGVIYRGKGSILFFDNNEVVTENVNGYSSFGIIGFEIGIIEILLGLRENEIYYKDLTSTIDENQQTDLDYTIKGKQWFIGGGVSF